MKFQTFNRRNVQEGRTASSCKISWRSLELWQRYRVFWIFQLPAAAILDFKNFKFVMVGRVNNVELLHRAKFCRNRSNRGRDMVIFRFFKMADAAILDCQKFNFSLSERSTVSNCVIMSNFVAQCIAALYVLCDYHYK